MHCAFLILLSYLALTMALQVQIFSFVCNYVMLLCHPASWHCLMDELALSMLYKYQLRSVIMHCAFLCTNYSYTIKTANILQQMPNPEANTSKSCCTRVRVSLGDACTTRIRTIMTVWLTTPTMGDHTMKGAGSIEFEEFVSPWGLARGKLVAIGGLQTFKCLRSLQASLYMYIARV